MGRLHCKRCSKEVHPGRGDYYLVQIEAVADPQPPIITQEDLDQDVGADIERLRRMRVQWLEVMTLRGRCCR